jgi:hypothetical protein
MTLSGICAEYLVSACASMRFYALQAIDRWRPLGDSNPCYRRERAVS